MVKYTCAFLRRIRRQSFRRIALFPAALALAGCGRVPSINVRGAFFPGWLLCFVIGLAAGIIVRLALIRAGITIFGAPFFYALTGISAALLSWIVLFSV